jgi:hypothetical protein
MLIAAVLFVAVVVASSPQVNFPFNSQLPPVAHAGVEYSFQFASTTFQPDSDKLQYSLINNPSWLSLNSTTRTLSGTPSAEDNGTVTFTIAAAGEAGAIANMVSTLVVSDHDAPQTKDNISQQLSNAGQLSGPKTLTLVPLKAFEITFSSDLFQAAGKSLSYYAILMDHTPLPAWISFSAPSLRFAGTTPALTSSTPQSYEILLIASEIPGFAAASISFTLAVSDHELLFKPVQQTIDLAKGDDVNVSGLRDRLFLDNAPISDENITSATTELPSWLSFDNHTFSITGTPPPGLMSQNISVTVEDSFGDTANCFLHLLFKSSLLTDEIGTLNITAGEDFEYIIPRSLLFKGNESISIDFGGLGEWLHFDPATLRISGKIPEDFASQDFQGSLTARSIDSDTNDTKAFELHVSGSGSHVYSGHATAGQNPGSTSAIHDQKSDTKRSGIIVGAVLASIFALVILAILLCRRNRHSKMGYVTPKAPSSSRRLKSPRSPRSPKSPKSPRKADISRPVFTEDEWENVKMMDVDLENGDGEDNSVKSTPEHPPRLDFHIPPGTKRTTGHVAMTSLDEEDTEILTSFDRSEFGSKNETGPSHHPHESMKIPTEMARLDSYNSLRPTKHRRQSTAVYRDRSSGLPVNRRLNSIGHGRHFSSPSPNNTNFSKYRRTMSSESNDTWSTGILSTAYSAVAHPQPSNAYHAMQLTTPMENVQSIRLVAASPCESLLDRRPMEDKRNSYVRKRASAQFQVPFFGAPTSRNSSSSYKSPPGLPDESDVDFDSALSPLCVNKVVRPQEDIGPAPKRELPDILRIHKPVEASAIESPSPKIFKDSLRKPPMERSFIPKHATAINNCDKAEGQYERPVTARHPPGKRSSTSYSLRAQELKASLNSLTGSKIFEDAETSESEYSQEEDDIEEYENRTTIRAHQFLTPLMISGLTNGERNNKRDSKQNSDRDSERTYKRHMKRSSRQESTPFSFAFEHGGKENESSTYSLSKHATIPSPSKAKGKGRVRAASPSPSPARERERPKTAIGQRSARPAYDTRTKSRISNQSSEHHHLQTRPISRQLSNKSRPLSRQLSNSSLTRHSRKSRRHQSRVSNSKATRRQRSRTQSSAFPYFDPTTLTYAPTISSGPSSPNKENASTGLPREVSGNFINYGIEEIPRIEELDSGSIGVRASNGRISTSARNSRLMKLHSQQGSFSRASVRNTTIGPNKTPGHAPMNSESTGLDPMAGQTLRPDQRHRSRTPLSVLDDGNGNTPGQDVEILRVVEGKARRPLSVEVDEKKRKTWGSLKAVVGMGRREKDERDESEGKMFI